MEWFGNTIAVTMHDLTRSDDGEAVMSRAAYDWHVRQKNVHVLQRACRCRKALIEYCSLPERFRARFEAKYGDPERIMKQQQIALPADPAARRYFAGIDKDAYRLPNGACLPEQKQAEYTLNAQVLNALRSMLDTQKTMRRAYGNRTPVIWSNIFAAAAELREAYGHTLPKSEARLRDKLRQYAREGYACLVSGKFCNTNTLKITKAAGRQIVALRRCRVPVYTTRQLFEEFNRIAKRRGWKPLASVSTLKQYLERPEVKPLWYDAVYGELAAKQLFARRNKTAMPTMRDSLWYGDGTKLNLYYKAVEHGRPVVRTVQVYEVVDAYSEMLLGYSVSATEHFDAQYAAFRMAVETAGCKPYEIVTDNQGGQRSRAAQRFFASLCRVNRPTAPYNAPSKSIESLFGRFQSQVLHADWRFTGGNISSKHAWRINREFLEANKDALYTFEQMLAAYAAARSTWNALPHPAGAGRSREEMYRASVNPEAEPVTELDRIDLFYLTTDAPSPFTADGITIRYRNRKYTFEVLTPEGLPDYAWRRENTGRAFFVRFDPLRMDRALLYVETPMGLRYETVAWPYLAVRRNLQEQQPGDAELIRLNDAANKRERVRRRIEAHTLELEHGVAPEQHGLRTPALRGIGEREFERLADAIELSAQPGAATFARSASGREKPEMVKPDPAAPNSFDPDPAASHFAQPGPTPAASQPELSATPARSASGSPKPPVAKGCSVVYDFFAAPSRTSDCNSLHHSGTAAMLGNSEPTPGPQHAAYATPQPGPYAAPQPVLPATFARSASGSPKPPAAKGCSSVYDLPAAPSPASDCNSLHSCENTGTLGNFGPYAEGPAPAPLQPGSPFGLLSAPTPGPLLDLLSAPQPSPYAAPSSEPIALGAYEKRISNTDPASIFSRM